MIDEIIKEIKDAENEAERLQKEAYQKGKEIVLNAENEAEKQKKATVQECKADVKRAADEARVKAAKLREAILRDGEVKAAEFKAEKEAACAGASDRIVAMLLEKYGV